MDEALKNRMFAEARFIRGLTYFNLVRLYGGAAIPETFTEGLEGLEIPRKTSEETFNYLLEDLKYAADNLPEKSALGSELWRASKGAALSFLGKAYL
ncbi:RagB/SusD family nutrient uptake outer membrane protein, partial [Escherichia coli]|uniref:RagB/SusD family nutrient uptake outer membrane protein n=2 Tax=Pseudomonadati TaxID=3379134 RepID=UPI0021174FA2